MGEEIVRDIDLVLITGAGASREFGNPQATGGGRAAMPLMGDWSDSLVRKLAEQNAGPELVGLSHGLAGLEFEHRLGRFLRLVQMFPDLEPILKPSIQAIGNSPLDGSQLKEWHLQLQARLQSCVRLIHESLYENFGWERTMPSAAAKAYGHLFQALRITPQERIVYATTNYDRLGEAVLGELGWRADCGERSNYHGPGVNSEIRVDVEGLLDGMPRYAPVLHLHGAIGWYRRQPDQSVIAADGGQFNSDVGDPVVMLPDPEKDYEAEPIVQAIWAEFRQALRRAKKVLVLGHSLNDDALVSALRTEVTPAQRVAITLLGAEDKPDEPDESAAPTLEIVTERLPGAVTIPLRFDKQMQPPEPTFKRWDEQLGEATRAAV